MKRLFRKLIIDIVVSLQSDVNTTKVARKLLRANKVAAKKIECINPRDTPPEETRPVDLVVSFLSCGFHYPVDTYLAMLDKALKPGGAAIFDLREQTAAEQVEKLAQFGTVTDITTRAKLRRVLLRKAA